MAVPSRSSVEAQPEPERLDRSVLQAVQAALQAQAATRSSQEAPVEELAARAAPLQSKAEAQATVTEALFSFKEETERARPELVAGSL